MAIHELEKLAGRGVEGDWVRFWLDGDAAEAPIRVGLESSATVVLEPALGAGRERRQSLSLILRYERDVLVQTVRCILPDVHLSTTRWRAARIRHRAVKMDKCAVRLGDADDRGAVGLGLDAVDVEGPEDGRWRRTRCARDGRRSVRVLNHVCLALSAQPGWTGSRTDERLDPQDVRDEYQLVPRVRRDLARFDQERARREPLGVG